MSDYRNQISIVQQEPLLFNESIESNILFGDQTADERRINEVTNQANAMAFVMQSDQDMASKAVQQQLMEDFKDMMKEN